MKKLLVLTAISVACLQLNAEASEKPFEESMSSKLYVNSKTPITTGFFDKTLEDKALSKEQKLKMAFDHVTHCKEKYELFLEQIGATYFRTRFLQNETLKDLTVFTMSFFEEKLERLEKKHLHFQSYLESVSDETKAGFTANPIGTYSGKYRGNELAQADYAAQKVKIWDILFTFFDQYPITKASINPVIQREIEAEAKKRADAFGKAQVILPESLDSLTVFDDGNYYCIKHVKAKKTNAKTLIDAIADKTPVRKLNDIIANQYDLKVYAEGQLKKWRARIGEKQKIDMLGDLLKNLQATTDTIEEEKNKPVGIEWIQKK